MSIREELEFDISSALRTVDRLELSLTDAFNDAVRGFDDDLTRVIRSVPPLDLDVDTAELRRDIERSLTAVTLDIDTDELRDDIRAAFRTVSAAGLDVDVNVDIDRAAIAADVEAALRSVDARSLSTQISRDLNAAGVTLDLSVDQAQIIREINQAIARANTSLIIGVNAANITGAINAAIANANSTVNLNANVAGIQDVEEAGSGFTFLGNSIKAATAALGAYVGIEGVQRVVEASSNLTEAQTKVQAVFGDSAAAIEAFADGSATRIGFARSEALAALGTFGNFFTSAGLSTERAVELSTTLTTLAADLASFNNISIDEAFIKLRAGLAGEIEPLRAIGISINEAEVKAKALELGLISLGEEADQQAKLQARYALILEKSANAQGDFARTSDNLANQQRILRAQFEDVLTVVGAPLVSPLLGILQTFVPLAGTAADAFGRVAGAIIPALDALATAAGPALQAAFDGIGDSADALAPALLEIGESAGTILGAMTPVIEATALVASGVTGAAAAVVSFGDAIPALAIGLGVAGAAAVASAGGFATLGVTLQGLFITIAANPIGAFITLLGIAAAALAGLNATAEETGGVFAEIEQSVDGLSNVADNAGDSVLDVAGAFSTLNKNFTDYLVESSAFARNDDVALTLGRTGISARTLAGDLRNGAEGFSEFAARAAESGEVVLTQTKGQGRYREEITLTAREIRNLDEDLGTLLATGELQAKQGEDLLSAFNAEIIALQTNEQLLLANLVATGQLTQAQADAAVNLAIYTGATDTYGAALDALATNLPLINSSLEATEIPLGQQTAAWIALTDQVLRGQVTAADYTTIAANMGVSIEDLAGFVEGAQQAVNDWVDSMVEKLPQASAAFDGLKTGLERGTDPTQVLTNLKIQTASINDFIANIEVIRETSPEAANFLLGVGEAAAGPFADDLAEGRISVEEFAEVLRDNQNALQEAETKIRDSAIPSAASALGADAASQFGAALDLGTLTEEEIRAAGDALREASAPGSEVETDAAASGKTIGESLAAGIRKGLDEEGGGPGRIMGDYIRDLEEAARREAESNSPSKLFARLGQDLTAGLIRGVESDQSGLQAAGAGTVATVASGAAGAAPSQVINSGGNSLQVVVQVEAAPGMTRDEAATIGSEVGRAARFEIEALVMSL